MTEKEKEVLFVPHPAPCLPPSPVLTSIYYYMQSKSSPFITRRSTCVVSALAVATLVVFLIAGCSGGGSDAGPASPVGPGYYVDATNGDDANAGSSSATPWKTLGKLSASTFFTGTTFYLKRGETWYEELAIPSSGVTVDAYGSGVLPIIDGSIDMGASGWAALGGDIYSKAIVLAVGEGLGNISQNGALLNFVPWTTNYAATLSSASLGTYSYDYPANTVYIKVGTNPATNSYRASRKFFGIRAANKSTIAVKNIQIQRFSLHGIGYENCTDCSVSSVVVTRGGGAVIAASPLLYAGNGIECGNACTNVLIDNVTVSDIFDSGISPQTFAGNQTASNITIQNSTVDKVGFAGVELSVLSNGGTAGSSLSNVTVSGLTITDSGKGWSGRRYGTEGHGIRIVADNGAGTLSNIQVQRSSISGSAGDGVKLGGEIGTVTINRTRLKANTIGINAADASATSLKLVLTASLIYGNYGHGVSFNVPNGAGFNIYQNTFYDNMSINIAVFNQAGEARLQNNIFYSSADMTHLYVASTLAGGIVNNNCYNNVANMFGYNSLAYSTVADFIMATAFEADGLGGPNVNLTSAAGENFSPLTTSQCRSLGATGIGVTLDYAGNSYTSPPASGALAY